MKWLTDEQAKKLHDSLIEATTEMTRQIADLNEKEAIKCIVEAIRNGDFMAHITLGEVVGQYEYKPYRDMDRIRQSNALLFAEVEKLKGDLEVAQNERNRLGVCIREFDKVVESEWGPEYGDYRNAVEDIMEKLP